MNDTNSTNSFNSSTRSYSFESRKSYVTTPHYNTHPTSENRNFFSIIFDDTNNSVVIDNISNESLHLQKSSFDPFNIIVLIYLTIIIILLLFILFKI